MKLTDEEMLKKWLFDKENKSFENGVAYACEKILNRCKHESMPKSCKEFCKVKVWIKSQIGCKR